MNKEYIYLDGKVVIEDEDGNKRLTDYSDKLDEILIQENLIETMEDNLSEIEQEIIDTSDTIRKKKKSFYFMPIYGIAFISFIYLLFNNFTASSFELLNMPFLKIFGYNITGGFILTAFSSITCASFLLFDCLEYKKLKRYSNGLTSEKDKLAECLSREQQKLNKMNESKNNIIKSEQFFVKQVDDNATLDELESYLQLYFACGYNEDIYANYYINGILQKKLGRYYSKDRLDEIESYLKESKNVKKKTLKK